MGGNDDLQGTGNNYHFFAAGLALLVLPEVLVFDAG